MFLALALSIPQRASADVFFNGTFATDDSTALIPFVVNIGSAITMQTTSFASSVGFEPVLTLFDAVGNPLDQDASGGTAPGSCAGRSIDPVSTFCLDGFIQDFLSPGSYQLALSESDNIPGGTLSDGFPKAGTGNFTPSEFGCPTGTAFLLFDCSQRTNIYAGSISGVGLAPEPSSIALTTTGFLSLLLAGFARRRAKR